MARDFLTSEFKIGNALVKIHGNCDKNNLKIASERFLKKVIKQKKEKKNA